MVIQDRTAWIKPGLSGQRSGSPEDLLSHTLMGGGIDLSHDWSVLVNSPETVFLGLPSEKKSK